MSEHSSGGVLADHEIRMFALSGMIDPYHEQQLQPSSYDVRLGGVFRVFEPHKTRCIDLSEPKTFAELTRRVEVNDDFTIHPGEAIIAQTEEYVRIPNGIVARIEGKSSVARLFLLVHMAGYIDPGYEGVVTLELVNMAPVPTIVHRGNLIAQLSFIRMSSDAESSYSGRYQRDTEATASRYGWGQD